MNYYFAGSHMHDYLINKGCRRLMSYHYQRDKEIGNWIERGGRPLFIDSGAYSAHTKGAEIDVDDYIDFINKYDENIEICAQLDTIPGNFGEPKTPMQLQEAAEKSWKNYLYMRERLKSPDKLLPIYHQGEGFEYLKRMLEFKPKIKYIGISPANDLSQKQKNPWIKKCFKIIRESSNPNVKTHAFGMTSLPTLKKFLFFSADSTAWLSGGRSGTIITRFGNIQISEKGSGDVKHVVNLSEEKKKVFKNEVEKYGYTLKELMEDYKERLKWNNIDFLIRWYEKYNYEPGSTVQEKLF